MIAWTPSMTEGEAFSRFLAWRFPNGPACPSCGCERVYKISTRQMLKCPKCKRQFSATRGTAFASHKVSFVAIYEALDLMQQGYSATALAAKLGVQYRTAWFLARRLLATPSMTPSVSGEMRGDLSLEGCVLGDEG